MITCTSAPRSISRRTRSGPLYAAMPPVTPSRMRLRSRSFIEGPSRKSLADYRGAFAPAAFENRNTGRFRHTVRLYGLEGPGIMALDASEEKPDVHTRLARARTAPGKAA